MTYFSRIARLMVFVVVTATSAWSVSAQTAAEIELREQAIAGMQKHYAFKKEQFEQADLQADVVMLGDSLIEGNNWSAAFPKTNVVNQGIGGDTTLGMLNRLDAVLKVQPRKVFLMAGINDLSFYGWPMAEVLDRYKTMIDTLNAAKVKVYVMSTLLVGPAFPPAVNVTVNAFNAELQSYCAQRHCQFIDLNPRLTANGALDLRYTADHLHLNGMGYDIWARGIAGAMR